VSSRTVLAAPLLIVFAMLPAACGGSGSPGSTPPSPGTSTPPGIQILVTNDDGVSAPGIDALVKRLRSLPGVGVQVVAPATNQSGTGGRTTPGALQHEPAATASGYTATAVTGYPADTIRVALDDLKLAPRLVVSGVNKGQNTGPLAAISGTVGAARAAAQRGIPAIAASSGEPADGENYDFAAGADYTVREVEKLLPKLGTPEITTATVLNLNVPSCGEGQIRGLRTLPPDSASDGKPILEPSDCTSTATPNDEITAFHVGFAVLTRIPATP
jgi:5'-nucleotidase